MQPDPSPQPADETVATPRRRARAPWIIALGGILVALGTVVTGATHWDLFILSGGLQTAFPATNYLTIARFESILTSIGNLLGGAGFLAIILGVAWAAWSPRVPDRSAFARGAFIVAVVGGLLVVAGLVILSVIGLYAYTPAPLPFGTATLVALDLAGRLVEAIGFFVAFLGIALSFGARP